VKVNQMSLGIPPRFQSFLAKMIMLSYRQILELTTKMGNLKALTNVEKNTHSRIVLGGSRVIEV
jgi:hypothetical protein